MRDFHHLRREVGVAAAPGAWIEGVGTSSSPVPILEPGNSAKPKDRRAGGVEAGRLTLPAARLLKLHNLNFPMEIPGEGLGKPDSILDALLGVTGGEDVIVPAAISNH